MSLLEITCCLDGKPRKESVAFSSKDAVSTIAADVRSKLAEMGFQDMADAVSEVIMKTTYEQLLRFSCQCEQGRNSVSIATFQRTPVATGSKNTVGGWG